MARLSASSAAIEPLEALAGAASACGLQLDLNLAPAARATRLPAGHPEAFLEAFANNYVNFSDTVRAAILGKKPTKLMLDFPDVEDGLRGMLFIQTLLTSTKSKQKWTKFAR